MFLTLKFAVSSLNSLPVRHWADLHEDLPNKSVGNIFGNISNEDGHWWPVELKVSLAYPRLHSLHCRHRKCLHSNRHHGLRSGPRPSIFSSLSHFVKTTSRKINRQISNCGTRICFYVIDCGQFLHHRYHLYSRLRNDLWKSLWNPSNSRYRDPILENHSEKS